MFSVMNKTDKTDAINNYKNISSTAQSLKTFNRATT